MTLIVRELVAAHRYMHVGGRALNGFRALRYPRPDTTLRAGLSRFPILDKNLYSQGADLRCTMSLRVVVLVMPPVEEQD